jgi:hypothetical protein
MAQAESTARPLPVYEDWDLATPGNQSLSTKFPALTHPDLRTLSEARLNFNLLADPAQLLMHLPPNYSIPSSQLTSGKATVTLGVQVNSTEVAKFDAAGNNLGFPGDRAGPSAGAFVFTVALNNNTSNLEQLVVAQWANPGNPIRNKLVTLGISPIEAKVVVEVEDAVENRTFHGSVKDALGRIFKVEAEAPFRGAAMRQVPLPPFKPRFLAVDPLAPITGTLFDFAFQMDLASFTSGVGGAEIEVNFSKAKHHKQELRLPHGNLPVEVPAQITFAMVDGLQIFFQQLPGQ